MSTSYYGLSTFTGTLPNAGNLTTTGGGSSLADTTGTETLNFNGFGWIKISPHGGSETIFGSLPANGTGHGWMLDNASLDGTTIPAGNWHILLNLICNLVSATGQINVRVWLLDPNTVTYTFVCDLASAAGVTVNTTHTAFTLTATGVGAVSIATGQRLYFEILWNQSSGGNASNLTSVQVASTSSGVAGASGGLELQVPSGATTLTGAVTFRGQLTLALGPEVRHLLAAVVFRGHLSTQFAYVRHRLAAVVLGGRLPTLIGQIRHRLAAVRFLGRLMEVFTPQQNFTIGHAAVSDSAAEGAAGITDASAEGAAALSDV